MNAMYSIIGLIAWLVSLVGINYYAKRLPKSYLKVVYVTFLIISLGGAVGVYNNYLKNMRVRRVNGMPVNSRVVWINDPTAAKGWVANAADHSAQIDQTVVSNMLAESMKALTGQTTLTDAWSWLFTNHNVGNNPYLSGEKVAIKVNNDNWADCTTSECANYQVINAVIGQLVVDAGVSESDIVVFDAGNSMPDFVISEVQTSFPQVTVNGYNCSGTLSVNGAPVSNDLINASYLINIPTLRTDSNAGVSLSFKNNVSATCDPSAFTNYFDTTAAGNSLVSLFGDGNVNLKRKTLLVIGDGIYGLKSGGPSGSPDGTNGISSPYPNSLFVAIDPVAADSVMVDYINSLTGFSFGANNPRAYMSVAAAQDMGTYETSCGTGTCDFTYNNIRLVQCNNGLCPATLPLVSTQTPTPTETPTNTPIITPTETATPTPTDTVSPSPTDTVSPSPTDTISPSPTDTVTPAPTAVPTSGVQTVTVANGDMQISSLISSTVMGMQSGSQSGMTPQLQTMQQTQFVVNQSNVVVDATTIWRAVDGSEMEISKFSSSELATNLIGGLVSGQAARGVLQWGIPNVSLIFDKPITLTINVGSEQEGKTLNVVRSISGQGDWTTDGVETVCVVASGKCTFKATKASYYAVTETIPVENNNTSNNNNSGSSGGGQAGPPGPPVCSAETPWSAPHLYKIVKTNSKTVQLHIAPGAGPVTYYYVAYGEKSKWDQHGAVFNQGYSSGSLVLTIGNLKPNKIYYFRVRNGNDCMPGPWGKEGASTRYKGLKNIK